MSVKFETYTLPESLNKRVIIDIDYTNEITTRIKKSNKKLIKKMNAIERREKRTWQKSIIHN